MVSRATSGDGSGSWLDRVTLSRTLFVLGLVVPVSFAQWVDVLLHYQPRWLFAPFGLAFACFSVWGQAWIVRTWLRLRAEGRERLVRDVMES